MSRFEFRPFTPMDTFQPGFTHLVKVFNWLDANDISYITREQIDKTNFEPYTQIAMSSRSATLFALKWSNLINVFAK